MMKKNTLIYVFMAFIALTLPKIIWHVDTYDESYTWTNAYYINITNFFDIIKMGGTGILWYMFIMPFAKLNISYPYPILIINYLICLLSVFLLWKKAPFDNMLKIIIIFSFCFLNYYAISSNGNILGLLGLFWLAYLNKNAIDIKRPVLYSILIILTAFTTPMASIGAWVFAVIFLYNLFKNKNTIKQRNIVLSIILLSLSFCFSFLITFVYSFNYLYFKHFIFYYLILFILIFTAYLYFFIANIIKEGIQEGIKITKSNLCIYSIHIISFYAIFSTLILFILFWVPNNNIIYGLNLIDLVNGENIEKIGILKNLYAQLFCSNKYFLLAYIFCFYFIFFQNGFKFNQGKFYLISTNIISFIFLQINLQPLDYIYFFYTFIIISIWLSNLNFKDNSLKILFYISFALIFFTTRSDKTYSFISNFYKNIKNEINSNKEYSDSVFIIPNYGARLFLFPYIQQSKSEIININQENNNKYNSYYIIDQNIKNKIYAFADKTDKKVYVINVDNYSILNDIYLPEYKKIDENITIYKIK